MFSHRLDWTGLPSFSQSLGKGVCRVQSHARLDRVALRKETGGQGSRLCRCKQSTVLKNLMIVDILSGFCRVNNLAEIFDGWQAEKPKVMLQDAVWPVTRRARQSGFPYGSMD